MAKMTFSTHHYKWNGRIYKQVKGGPIGLRATGSVAKTTMDDWIEKYKSILSGHGINVHLIKKYVDDVLVLVDNLRLGTRLEGTLLRWREEWEEEDARLGRSAEENTMDILRTLANQVHDFLEFTSEVS